MLHFGTLQVGHTSVWGLTINEPEQDFENDIAASQKSRTHKALVLAVGQRLGGIGFYRVDKNQPRFSALQGAYLFDTYLTAYNYVQGQYSFALQVSIVLSDMLNLSEVLAVNQAVGLVLQDNLTLTDTLSAGKITFVALTDALTLAEALALNQVVSVSISDTLNLSDAARTNLSLLSYVVNLNTMALVKYHNYNFDSYAHLNGKVYGILDDGIYELDGETDNGVVIDAQITTGKTDFGSDKLKQLPYAYLGTHTNGDLMLKVVDDSGTARYYRMAGQLTGDLQTNKLMLGKGVRARYWQFELSNIDGCDFTLDSILFRAIELTRRAGR